MAREQESRVRGLAQLGGGDARSVGLGVYASPTATPGKAFMSPEVEGLLKGLSALSASVTHTANETEKRDTSAGRDFARSGGSKEEAEKKGKSFLDGYLEGSGEASAITDAEELAALYQSKVDKRDPDIAKFVGEFYQSKLVGSTNGPVFQRGYDRIFGAEALKLRSKHGEGLALQVIDKKLTVAQQRIDYMARTLVSAGQPLGPEFLAAVNVIARESALSHIEKDEAILLTLETYGAKGIPSVFEVARAPRVDEKTGEIMPSLYDNPRHKKRIEDGERTAARIKLMQSEADDKKAKQEREDRQQEVIGEILQKAAAGDREGARALAFSALQNRTLFTRGGDIADALKMVTDADDDIEKMLTAGEGDIENEVLMGIYTGKVTKVTDISGRTDLGSRTKMRLITSLYTWMSQQRQADAAIKSAQAAGRAADAAARAADREAFRVPEFTSAHTWLREQLKPRRPEISIERESDLDRAEARSRATAERELINWQSSTRTTDPAAIQAKATEIVKRYKELEGDPTSNEYQIARAERMGIPYRTVRELVAAHDAGKVDPLTFQMFLPVLKGIEKGKK